MDKINPRTPSENDITIARRLHERRLKMVMSQATLGARFQPPLTFQQVQKYERGINRISAGRLQEAADILEVNVAWFFKGLSKRETGKVLDDLLKDGFVTRSGDTYTAVEGMKVNVVEG